MILQITNSTLYTLTFVLFIAFQGTASEIKDFHYSGEKELSLEGDWMFYWEHGGEEAYFTNAKNTLRQISNTKPIVSPINSTEEEAYHSDIYTKGAYVMHSLRWILGDDVFFPMLKAFATDARFTYENQVDTRDFIDFVILCKTTEPPNVRENLFTKP